MFSEVLDNEQLVALSNAYAKACAELGLSPDDGDKDRREHLAMIMLALSKGGETDPEVIRLQAVHQMRPPAAGLFHQP